MKITCEACGSKYTIADEKVQGKRVKVRCKNCSASIVVNGAGSSPDLEGTEGEALDAPVVDSGDAAPKAPVKKNAWSVNLTDDDSRDMTTEELVQGWKDGLVTQDAYVWKDGMGDWKPILEVPELKAKLTVVRPKAESVVTSTKRGPSASAPDDLFGAGGGVDVNLGGEDKKPTGARNESSVLFSLDALKAPGVTSSKGEDKTSAEDLFGGLGGGLGGGVLGTNTDLLTAPAKDPPPAPVGARVVAPVAASLPEAKKSSTGLIAAAAIVALGALGGGYLVMNSKSDEDPAKIAAEAAAKAEREAKEAAAAEIQKAKDAAAAELRKKEEELAKALAAGQKPPEPAKSAEPEAPKPAAGTTTATAAAPATTAKPATTGAAPAETPKPAAAAGAFDAGAAKAALTTAAANAASCGTADGPTGAGKVEVTFAPSGRVTSANVVSGPFGGTPVGGCIASTFRKARVPAFSGDPVTVSKSFRIN